MNVWNVGDLALCIKGGQLTQPGKIYTVNVISVRKPGSKAKANGYIRILKERELWFKFDEINMGPKQYANSNRFVKVTPEDEDEFDKEIIDKMKENENAF